LQKGYAGASSLMSHLSGLLHTGVQENLNHSQGQIRSFVICLQEPPVHKGKVSGFGSQHTLFYDIKCGRPRTAIYASNDLNLWLLPGFTEGDMTTCLWRNGGNDIVVTSVYMDITLDCVWPPKLERLIRTCQDKNQDLLICADTNAHSPVWGSKNTNQRGERLEELISNHCLNVMNTGTHFTFFNRRSATVIDVTLCNASMADRIQDWNVSSNVQGSDHLLLEFFITISERQIKKVRNLKLGDWNLFQDALAKRIPSFPKHWTVKHLEMQSKDFTQSVKTCLEISHPLREVSSQMRIFHWYTPELHKLRKKVKIAFSHFRLHRSEESHDHLKSCRREYSKAVRREKRKAWQRFCGDSKSPKEVAIINNIVKRKERHVLGLIRRDDGQSSDSPEESINHLLQTHFPGCDDGEAESGADEMERCDLDDPNASFITEAKVRHSISTFGEYKAPGLDGLQPAVFRHLNGNSLTWLTNIFKASYLLGYTPSNWRKAKVIFIPKAGKEDYSQARSFRPITLSTFVVKILERIMLWELNATTLADHPLSANQHAFRKGYSTDSAISNTVETLERGVLTQKYSLGVFLDIQGAFDNVKPESIIQGMKDKGITDMMCHWYEHYLRHRSIEFEHRGVKACKRLHLGTPQGGVLSPLMWNLAFESLIENFQDGQVKISGFADDAALLTVGDNPCMMVKHMQRAVNFALQWGAQKGLTFSASKTQSVLFTRRRKFQMPPNIMMGGQNIPYSNTAKYLGLTLDSKLSWVPHFNHKIKAAKGHLIKVRGAMGKLWGLPPNLGRWLYTGIVRPSFSYGCLAWAGVLETEKAKNQCTKVNRLALLSLGHFRKSTPTAGLEVINDVLPLDLFVKREALLAWARTRRHSNITYLKGHRAFCRELLKKLEIQLTISDTIDPTLEWVRSFKVDKASYTNGYPEGRSDIDIYTDGSKYKEQVGSGVAVYVDKKLAQSSSFHLGDACTVFQGEVYAIKQAAMYLSETDSKYQMVHIYVDSRAALDALANPRIFSNLVKSTVEELNQVGQTNFIHLKWIKAHVGIEGNEKADELAKYGAQDLGSLAGDLPAAPNNAIKKSIKDGFDSLWNLRWQNRNDCRQTKHWFPVLHRSNSRQILRLDRTTFSLMVQIITGHNFMKRHSSLVDPDEEAECRLCLEDEESSFHIFAECPALARLRQMCFGCPVQSAPLIWSTRQVVSFLREAQIDFLQVDQQEG